MQNKQETPCFYWLNILECLGILVVLLVACLFQFYLHELPCPLCLLQRVGFVAIATGLLFNLRFGLRPAHYTLVLLGALFTAAVALRQIALHVIPGTGYYGSAFLGFHMYTWSFILSVVIILYTCVLLGFNVQYQSEPPKGHWTRKVAHLCFVLVFCVILVNAVSVFLECGIGQCPENPSDYKVLVQ